MPKAKATPKRCPELLDGQPCRLECGIPHHKMQRNDTSGLGLGTLIHRLADGTEWTKTGGRTMSKPDLEAIRNRNTELKSMLDAGDDEEEVAIVAAESADDIDRLLAYIELLEKR